MKGFAGAVGLVDLSAGSFFAEPLDPELGRRLLGGPGVAHALLGRHLPPRADPLGPDNVIILSAGLLSGTTAPGAGKISATAKLPLSGTIGSCSGSMVSHRMKFAGFDHLIIKGRSEKPVWLMVRDGSVQIEDASDLWGLSAPQTRDKIAERLGPDLDTIAIGPAGENKVSFSLAVINHGITLGRGGLGAVWGAKNLKAVALQGRGSVSVADPSGFSKALREPRAAMLNLKYRADWLRYGPAVAMMKFGVLLDGSRAPRVDDPGIEHRNYACPGCPLGEKVHVRIKEGPHAGCEVDMAFFPDAVNVWSSRFKAGGLREALVLRSLTNAYGLDDYTLAWMTAKLVELARRGALDPAQLSGLNLDDPFAMARSLIEMTARREGLGDVLADGPEAMYERLNVPLELREQTIRNMDPMFDPRIIFNAIMVSQSVNPRGPYIVAGLGPDFLPGRSPEQMRGFLRKLHVSEDRISRIVTDEPRVHTGRLCVHAENWYSLISSLGVCARQPVSQAYSPDNLAPIIAALTGMKLSPEELMTIGERSWNLLRLLNGREGFDRRADIFPRQFLQPQENPPHAALRDYYGRPLSAHDVANIFDGYYEERGWDRETGLPTAAKLSQLALEDLT